MKEELITFKTAKLAQQKGFNVTCLNRYTYAGKLTEGMVFDDKDVFAPTQALLQKWLRDFHDILVMVETRYDFYCRIYSQNFNNKNYNKFPIITSDLKSYEEALEEGLQQALKLIK